MNFLFYSWEFPPYGSGVGTYVGNMAKTLVNCGHGAIVVTRRCNEKSEEEVKGVRVFRLYDSREIRSPALARRVLDLAEKEDVDVIEGADHLGELGTLTRYASRPPLLVRMHSCNVHRMLHSSQVWYGWQYLAIRLACVRMWRQVRAERISIEKADALLAPSQALLDESIRQGLRLPSIRAVVPNPYVISSEYSPSGSEESAIPTILFVGRTDMGKGVGYLPRIMQEVLARRPDAVLEIAGGDSYARGLGWLQKWLQKKFAKAQVAENVRWLGQLDAAELDKVYQRAWVQIIPSRWDTFPSVALEGMARRKPIVASFAGGLPEMLANTANLLSDPGLSAFSASILHFLEDKQLREKAGADGHQRVATQYSPKVVGSKYLDFVKSWLNNE